MNEPAPIPDVAGGDVLGGTPMPSPTERAQALASMIEAENAARLQRLASFGKSPEQFEFAALAIRLEALIDTLPDAHKAVVEVNFEAAMAAMLDEAIAEISKPRLLTPRD